MAEKISILELDIKQEDVVKKLADITAEMDKLRNMEDLTAEQSEINKAQLKALSQEYQNNQKVLIQLTKSETEQLGTLQKLALSNKNLRAEQQKLNLETKEGQKRNKEIVIEINKNTAAIRANSDENVRNKMNVGNYANSQVEAMKGIGTSMVAAAGPVALVTGALNKLKEAFFETEIGAKTLKVWGESVKTYFQTLVGGGGFTEASANTLGAIAIAQKMDEIRKGDRQDLIEVAKLEATIHELRLKSVDATKNTSEQLELIKQAEDKEKELLDFKIADRQEELDAIKAMLVFRSEDTSLLDRAAQLEAEIIGIRSDKSLKLASKENALAEKKQAEDKKNRAELMSMEELNLKTSEKLWNEYEKNRLDAIDKKKKAAILLNEELFQAEKDWMAEEDALLNSKDEEELANVIELNGKIGILKRDILESSINDQWELKRVQLENDKNAEIAAAEGNGQLILLINRKYANFQMQLDDDIITNKLQNAVKYADEFTAITDSFYANNLVKLENQKNKELSIEGLTVEQKGIINDEYAKKRDKVEERQFRIAKAAGIAKALLNAYVAVSEVFAAEPGELIAKSIAAGIALTQGLLTVSKIRKVNYKSGDSEGGTSSGGSSGYSAPIKSAAQMSFAGSDVLTSRSGSTSGIENAMVNALRKVPMQPVVITDKVTAKQNEGKLNVATAIA